jgi:hypothetical protein
MASHCDNARTHLRCNSGRGPQSDSFRLLPDPIRSPVQVGPMTTDTSSIRPELKKCSEPWIKLRCLSPRANNIKRLSGRRLSEKLMITFADKGWRVVSATDSSGRNLGFLDRSRYVAPQLHSHSWVDPVPDPLLRKSGSAGNRTRTSGSVARNSDH